LLLLICACQTEAAKPSPTSTFTTLLSTAEPVPTETETITPTQIQEDNFVQSRALMVDEQIAPRGIDNEDLLTAMRKIPRHEFVPDDMIELAYNDHPLPIGYGQTISQPFIVALMTQSLNPKPDQRILEIGTGSGYQAAVLAEMGVEVYTVEIIPELAQQANQRLDDLGYTNIHKLNADGYFGWQEFAPFDAIMVTAAPDHLPQSLANQLSENGRLVIPIGPVGFLQTLWLFEKVKGELSATNLGGVTFVPLTGEH
jgi:protein-L-isoaspartate(D-aspartate) O-methyltransferase